MAKNGKKKNSVKKNSVKKNSKGVAKKNSTAVVPVNFGQILKLDTIPGLEEASPKDVLISRIKLLQSTSEEVKEGLAEIGRFYDPRNGYETDELQFVPILFFYDRTYFNKQFKLECSSWDLKKGSSGRKCDETCQCFDWWTDEEENRRAPKCSLNYNFISVLVGDPDEVLKGVVIVPFSKTSTTTGQQLISSAAARGVLWSHVYKLITLKKSFEGGDAYVPRKSDVRATTDQERAEALKNHEALRAMRDLIRVEYGSSEIDEAEDGEALPFDE